MDKKSGSVTVSSYDSVVITEPKHDRDDLMNPYWIEDKALKKGEVDFLPQAEIKFWQELLEKYLYPIDEDKDEKVKFWILFSINRS